MRFDPAAYLVGVELIGERDASDRYAGLQAGRDDARLEFRRVTPAGTTKGWGEYGSVHVSTKKIVDTMLAAGHLFSNVGRLDAYARFWQEAEG